MSIPTKGYFFHLSRFLIAFGILVLVVFLFAQFGEFLISRIFGVNSSEIIGKSAGDFAKNELVALKFYQTISAFSFIAAAFVIIKIYREPFSRFAGIAELPRLKALLFGLGIFIAMIPLMSWMIEYNATIQLPERIASEFQDVEQKSDNLYEAFLNLNSGMYFVFNLFMMALLPALGEELIFRGIFMRLFTSWTKNIHLGVLFSAFMFAALHFQPYKILPMFFIAVILGYLYYLTRSLWVPILVHLTNNAVVVFADWGDKQGYEFSILSDDYHFTSTTIIVSTLILGALFFALKSNANPKAIDEF